MQGLGFDGPVFGPVLDFEPSVLGPGLVLSLKSLLTLLSKSAVLCHCQRRFIVNRLVTQLKCSETAPLYFSIIFY